MTDTTLALGRVIADKYRLDALLGEGGMGAVFRATQLTVNRAVAVKLIQGPLLKHPEVEKRFRREAEAMGRLQHPATVRLYDFGATREGELYMAMELLAGRDLATHLAHTGALSVSESLRIAKQVLLALDEAHAHGIVHRDLKPANVFLAELHGGEVAVKVMDFGIAGIEQAAEGAKLTRTGAVLGTPAYMSPEQAQGIAIDGRSDLYALGVMIFEMVTGRVPFVADSAVSLLLAQVTTQPPKLADVLPGHPELAQVQPLLDALLQKSPADRPESASAAMQLVDRMLSAAGGGGASIATALDPTSPRSVRRLVEPTGVRLAQTPPTQADTLLGAPGRVSLRRTGLGALALGGLVLAGWALGGRDEPPAPPSVQVATPEPSTLYSVQIASSPSAAKVLLEGVVVGSTPYRFSYRKPQTLTLTLPGYQPYVLVLTETSEPHAVVQLEPLAAGEAPGDSPTGKPRPARRSPAAEAPKQPVSPEPAAPLDTAVAAAPAREREPAPAAKPQVAAAPVPKPAGKPQSISEAMHNVVDAVSNRVSAVAAPALRTVNDAKHAYKARQIDERTYENTIRALKVRRAERIKAEKANYAAGRITRDEYSRRVDRIDAEYKGQ
jgi:eukaryotic-like serine/threonine-protein kinase